VADLSAARRQAEEALAYNRRHIATEAGVPRFWTEHETRLDSALRALLAANGEAERLLREVAGGAVVFDDERVPYIEVQIDAETWAEVKRFAATAPAPQRSQTLTRAEAIAAGIPIPPDAVGVRIWGASVTAPAPPAGDGVREAAERLRVRMSSAVSLAMLIGESYWEWREVEEAAKNLLAALDKQGGR
jgi:hypothetical protein